MIQSVWFKWGKQTPMDVTCMLLLPLKETCLLTYKQRFRVIVCDDFSLIIKASRNSFHYPLSYLCMLSRPTLCNPTDCSPPGSSVHGIPQARILEWVAILSSRGSSWPRDGTHVSCSFCIGRWVLYFWATWEALFSIWDTLRQQGGENYHDKA